MLDNAFYLKARIYYKLLKCSPPATDSKAIIFVAKTPCAAVFL